MLCKGVDAGVCSCLTACPLSTGGAEWCSGLLQSHPRHFPVCTFSPTLALPLPRFSRVFSFVFIFPFFFWRAGETGCRPQHASGCHAHHPPVLLSSPRGAPLTGLLEIRWHGTDNTNTFFSYRIYEILKRWPCVFFQGKTILFQIQLFFLMY